MKKSNRISKAAVSYLKRRMIICILAVILIGLVNSTGAVPVSLTLYQIDSSLSAEQTGRDSIRPAVGSVFTDGDVPSYYWHYGCSPTSGAMIIGYWDNKPGYENLFDGDTSVESDATRTMIASQAHITAGTENGYTYGDWHNSSSYPNHESNPDCIADFMHTVNGGSYPDGIASGLEAYAEWDNPATSINESYQATALNMEDPFWGGTFTYSTLKTEIDASRPVLLDIYTYYTSRWRGHSIVAYGYQDNMFTVYSSANAGNIIVPGIAIDDTWQNGTGMSEWLVDTDEDGSPDSFYNSYIDPNGIEWWPYYTDSDTGGSSYIHYWDWSVGDAVTLDIVVPEPATIVLLCLGSLGLVSRKRMKNKIILLPAAAILISTFSVCSFAASFQGLGDLPGGPFSSGAYNISADGSTVVGESRSASGFEAFRWTSAEGMTGLGNLPGGSFGGRALSTSSDGSVVVGFSSPSSGYHEAFYWTSGSGMIGLGDFPGGESRSEAIGVCANGSVVVGCSSSSSGYQAFHWTAATGMVGLGDLPGGASNSYGYGISADGSTVIGSSDSSSGHEAFRWTSTGGMTGLGDLPGGSFKSQAFGVSADGSVITGYSYSSSGYAGEAFRWTAAGGMIGLGFLPGSTYSEARGISADGSVIVGFGSEAFYWTVNDGMQSVKGILTNSGLDLTDWTLQRAYGVSADGLTVVGYGINPDGFPEAWIATVPEPATIVLLCLGSLGLVSRKRMKNKKGNYLKGDKDMKTIACFTLAILTVCPNLFALPVQWKTEDGGNGHYYEAVDAQYQITWVQARAAAVARGGYLASITSAEENLFISNLISDPGYWSGWDGAFGPWIGGMQLPGSVEPDGGWCWVSGEDFVYSNWREDPKEPNNDGGAWGNEDAIHFAIGYVWNDLVSGNRYQLPTAYVVETVPEPATICLLALGSLVLIRNKNK